MSFSYNFKKQFFIERFLGLMKCEDTAYAIHLLKKYLIPGNLHKELSFNILLNYWEHVFIQVSGRKSAPPKNNFIEIYFWGAGFLPETCVNTCPQ